MTKHIKKYLNVLIAAAILASFILLLLFQSGHLARDPKVTAVAENCYEQTLQVITDDDYSPYSFYDEKGQPSGYDIELITLIANKLKMNLDLRMMEWDEGIDAIVSGGADVLMTCDYSDSFEGVEKLVKSEPTSSDDFIIYSKKRVSSASELFGKRIAIMENGNVTPQMQMLGLIRYCIKYEDNRAAMQALIDGDADCSVMRQAVGEHLLGELKAKRVKGYVSAGRSYMCFGVYNDNPDIAKRINGAIEDLKLSGEIDELKDKWLTTFIRPYTFREVLTKNMWIIFLFAICVVIFLVSINRSKKRELSAQEAHKRELLEHKYLAEKAQAEANRIIENFTNDYFVAYKLNLADDTLSILRMDGNVVGGNPDFQSFDQVAQSLIANVIYEPDIFLMQRELSVERIRQRLSDAHSYSVEHRILKSGVPRWSEMKVSQLDTDIAAIGFAIKDKDIILHRLENKQSEDYLGLYSVDLDAGLLTVVKKTDAYGILSEGDAAPFKETMLTFAERQTGETRDFFLKLADPEFSIQQFAYENKHTYSYPSRILGDDKWITVTSYVIARHEDGTPAVFTLGFSEMDTLGRDRAALMAEIADQKNQLEQQQVQIQEALAMAQSANRAKTTFLNNMSHDIRTPMNAIIGYTGLAASHIDNKELVQNYLGKITQSSNHLLSLINDVLDMSRIESGKMHLNEKPESLSEILHTLRDIVQANLRAKQLDFYVDAVDVHDEGIVCDKLRLNQVLLNILSNAIKYTPVGGIISMRVCENIVKPTGYAEYDITVKDNGIGMSKEFLKTIYDPFTRVKSTTVSGIQGTGLGMAITKNIIDMMGGKIDIESEQGVGTEVKMKFDFKLQTESEEQPALPELNGLRGLIVDDDAHTCMSVSRMLKDIGMRSLWCTSGKEAIIRVEEAVKNNDMYKLYIIDCMMPDMNGIETTRRIRRIIGDDIPIIILSAYDWGDIEEEARDAGVNAFINKPLFPSDLNRILADCLGKNQEGAEAEEEKLDLSGKKILLVEDNELNREITTAILQEYGCTVLAAEDGDIAVQMMKDASSGDYDLILMDIQMPTMDGYEATRQIRALGTEISKIPILAMTANAFEEDRKAAFEAGMDEHIAKPIDNNALKEKLSRFLRR